MMKERYVIHYLVALQSYISRFPLMAKTPVALFLVEMVNSGVQNASSKRSFYALFTLALNKAYDAVKTRFGEIMSYIKIHKLLWTF